MDTIKGCGILEHVFVLALCQLHGLQMVHAAAQLSQPLPQNLWARRRSTVLGLDPELIKHGVVVRIGHWLEVAHCICQRPGVDVASCATSYFNQLHPASPLPMSMTGLLCLPSGSPANQKAAHMGMWHVLYW